MERSGKTCSSFVGTTGAAGSGKSYWAGNFRLAQEPKGTSFDLRASFSRPKQDEVFPVEIAFLGGNFAAAKGRYFFWESDSHWTGWKETNVTFSQPLRLEVRQRGNSVEGYVNDALVGTFELQQTVAVAPVGVMFKSAKGQARKVNVTDVALESR